MVIGVDVDQTLVDTYSQWLKYIEDNGGVKPTNYIIDEEMYDFDIYNFWRNRNLYDDIELYTSVIKPILYDLSTNNTIVFISKCFEEHVESKQKFLQRNFNFKYEFVNLENKWEYNCDVMIDDNEDILKRFKENNPLVSLFKAKLPYVTSEKFKVIPWYNIGEFIKTGGKRVRT